MFPVPAVPALHLLLLIEGIGQESDMTNRYAFM